MLSFSHPKITKSLMIADMEAHAAADRLIDGTYSDEIDGEFRGCAVGCSIHTINRRLGTNYNSGDHAALAEIIGVPEALMHLQDRIFEGLPSSDRAEWPRRFYASIPEGADLTPAVNRILARILREVALPAVTVDEWGVRQAIAGVCLAIETGEGLDAAAYAAYAARAAYAAAGAAGAARAAYAAAYQRMAAIVCEEMERCA